MCRSAHPVDGRQPCEKGIPSNAEIRTYRALNRDVTYGRGESKEAAKIKAESFARVNTFVTALQKVQTRHPGIFDNPDNVWNLDETYVDGEFGQRIKRFCGSHSHHGGYTACQKGSGRHLTAVIIASASGKCSPLFAIAAGKYVMQQWLEPLPSQSFQDQNGHSHWLAQPGWMPADVVLRCTEKGSIDMRTMPILIQHVNRYIRQFVPSQQPVVLILDGHSSRNGVEWIEEALNCNIELVVLPANTTNFLQPCHDVINKQFQKEVRCARDKLLRMALINVQSMGFKLKLAVAGHAALTPDIVRQAFINTGLWPMDFRFMEKFKQKKREHLHAAKEKAIRLQNSSPVPSVTSVQQRHADGKKMKELAAVLSRERSPSVAIDAISKLLKERETVSSILQGIRPSPVANSKSISSKTLCVGAPAQCLTVGDNFQRRKDAEIEAGAEANRKAIAKKDNIARRALEKKQKEEARAERKRKKLYRNCQNRNILGEKASVGGAERSDAIDVCAQSSGRASDDQGTADCGVAVSALMQLASKY